METPPMPSGQRYALLTDFYQLTMLQAYRAEEMHEIAVFDLFARRLPKHRNYLIACGLDEFRIDDLLRHGAPINAFGVGTRMGTSADMPFIDNAYKLVSYAGQSRMKFSTGKMTLPGRKQVFRLMQDGHALHDVIALREESREGIPLMQQVMKDGRQLQGSTPDLESVRNHCRKETAALPAHLHELKQTEEAYMVQLISGIEAARARLAAEHKH